MDHVLLPRTSWVTKDVFSRNNEAPGRSRGRSQEIERSSMTGHRVGPVDRTRRYNRESRLRDYTAKRVVRRSHVNRYDV